MVSQQRPLPPGERRRRKAEAHYEFEMLLREEELSSFIYDDETDLFRFKDGRFAFSRTHVDAELLEEQGYEP